jgi:sec-independent protein translocase protein TatC
MMTESQELTFGDHLDILRSYIIRIMIVTALCSIIAFCAKDQLFYIILAPKDSNFITYKLLGTAPFSIKLVNIGLTEQFMVHMQTAFFFGILCASPYVICQLYKFISPALYKKERYYGIRILVGGYVMFLIGILVNYLLIFPLTVHFLGTYQINTNIQNMLSIQSYMDTLFMMSIIFGIVFEIPIISWLLALFGLLKAEWMRYYRRQAIVVILFVAAIITPTSDAFTMLVVSLPIWLLYEFSIWIVQTTST